MSVIAIYAFYAILFYVCMWRGSSASVDIVSWATGSFLGAAICILLLVALRVSFSFELDAWRRSALFSVSGMLIGIVVHSFESLCCQEDKRKHHLGLCDQHGIRIETLSGSAMLSSDIVTEQTSWEEWAQFAQWIAGGQWWRDIRGSSIADDGESCTTESIIVYNQSLKLIKVCLYAPEDIVCAVPYGGISGRCVGFIQAKDSRVFDLGRQRSAGGAHSQSGRKFNLKIFQPGLFDKELARCCQVRSGQCFAFSDIDGMVRHSPVLSSAVPRAMSNFGRVASAADSSEDEFVPPPFLLAGLGAGEGTKEFGGDLKRNRSFGSSLHVRGSLQGLEDFDGRSRSPGAKEVPVERPLPPRSRALNKKAGLDEIVVWNRSSHEIRACLYRWDDYCCMVPLAGKITEVLWGGYVIEPGAEVRIVPRLAAVRQFTLKVYSTGPGSKELTYLTTTRGNTYTFKDSLLS